VIGKLGLAAAPWAAPERDCRSHSWQDRNMRPSVTLSRHRDAIIAIIRRHRADNPRLFGSTARGQDSEASDLDLLIDPAPGMTLFDLGAIIDELENLLGVAVDVVTPGALPPAIAKSILQDIRPL